MESIHFMTKSGQTATTCLGSILLNATVPTFNSCTKCAANPGIIHNRTPDCNPFFWILMPLMTSQLNVALIHKLRGSLMYLAYLFGMISTGFGTTRHCQTSGRLVQELNGCTVCLKIFKGCNGSGRAFLKQR